MTNVRIKDSLVSVIMPVYNGGRFLKKAIKSILGQTYKNFELIIIDDGSNDGSSEIINLFKKKDKRVFVIRNKKPSGYAGEAAANQGIKIAKGKYIARMDADDISLPDRLKKQVNFLERNNNYFLVGSNALIINEFDKVIGQRKHPITHKEIYKNFYLKNCIIHPSVLFRNEKKESDFYQLLFPDMNDYVTWMKLMSANKKFANIDEFLVKYRIHGKNATFSKVKNKFKQNILIKDFFVKNFGYRPSFVHRFIVKIQYFLIMLIPQKIITWIYINFMWNK